MTDFNSSKDFIAIVNSFISIVSYFSELFKNR